MPSIPPLNTTTGEVTLTATEDILLTFNGSTGSFVGVGDSNSNDKSISLEIIADAGGANV